VLASCSHAAYAAASAPALIDIEGRILINA
jgi:hypothetical protein